jgi:hypothetical protein
VSVQVPLGADSANMLQVADLQSVCAGNVWRLANKKQSRTSFAQYHDAVSSCMSRDWIVCLQA